jgi:coenzyme PQQ precursor peptide PqqA
LQAGPELAIYLRRAKTSASPVSYDPLNQEIERFRRSIKSRRDTMKWAAPIVSEICVGMEVTSYESAEIDTFN